MEFRRILNFFKRSETPTINHAERRTDWSVFLPKPELLEYHAGLDPIATSRSLELLASPLNCVDFRNRSLTEATIIGTEITHRVLGIKITDMDVKIVDNYEMGLLWVQSQPE